MINRRTTTLLLSIILIINLSSCHTKKYGYPLVFRNQAGFLHNDIILQSNPNILTEYSSGAMMYALSTWKMYGDTIFAYPKLEYGIRNGNFWFLQIAPSDSTVTSITKKYIMMDNRLEDITDYSQLFNSLDLLHPETPEMPVYYYIIK